MIPVKIGLLGPSGQELAFSVTTGRHKQHAKESAVLLADKATSVFVLSGVSERPVPSLLRDFSAPVKMTVKGQTDEDLVFIMAHDTDQVNRCETSAHLCAQRFCPRVVGRIVL
jgi:aminopeptidase N